MNEQELLARSRALNDERKYQEVIKLLPDDLLAPLNSKDLYLEKTYANWKSGNYSAALATADQVFQLDPRNKHANFLVGEVYKHKQEFEKAIKYFNEALDADPQYQSALHELMSIYEKLKNHEKVIELGNRAVAIDSRDDYAYESLAYNYYKLNQHDKAISFISKVIELKPNHDYALVLSGDIYADMKQYAKAIESYNKAIGINPHNRYTYSAMAEVYRYQGSFDEAEKNYRKAIEVDPQYAFGYSGLASLYRKMQQNSKAIEMYEKAIQADPDHIYAYTGLGNVYRDTQEYDKAILMFRKALEKNPKYEYTYDYLAEVYEIQGQLDKAVEMYTKAIEINPDDGYSYYKLGELYASLKQYDAAIECYKKYIERKTDGEDYFATIARAKIPELVKLKENANYGDLKDLVYKIRNLLLFKDGNITHYTSLSTARALILGESPMRISEGSYLNDTSEGRELFTFLSLQVKQRPDKDTIAELFSRKPFIGSFVTESKYDDLALWRFYGKEGKDEAKGCAITLNKDEFLTRLKNKVAPPANSAKADTPTLVTEEFNFYRVAYRRRNKDNLFIIPGAEQFEDELNGYMQDLHGLITAFKAKADKTETETQDVLELLNEIAYLFKSDEYHYEQELRLVVKATGFLKNINADSQPPRVYIELISITPVLKRVTLGPKVERADEWASAFYYYLEKQGLFPDLLISHLPFK